jgi:hypothetical protein
MLRLLTLLVAFFVASCFFGKSTADPEKTTEVMITFVQRAQAGFWKEAMGHVTPEERDAMMENGQVLPEYRAAVSRIRLSTIKNMELGLDGKKRLVGLLDILDESNEFYKSSDEKVVIDPSKLEDLSVKRMKMEKEEAEKRREEAEKGEPPQLDFEAMAKEKLQKQKEEEL